MSKSNFKQDVNRLTLFSLSKLNFYEILGFDHQSSYNQISLSDIRRAYRRRALQVHPDKNKSDPNAEQIFGKVFLAYETLIEEKSRKAYDLKLSIEEEKRQRRSELSATKRRMLDELNRREEEASKAVRKTSENIVKDKIQAEIEKFHKEILREKQKSEQEAVLKRSQSHLKSKASTTKLHLPEKNVLKRSIMVKFNERNETEDDLRLIFEHYGRIEHILLRQSTALISFSSRKAVKAALIDKNIKDFGISVSRPKPLNFDQKSQHVEKNFLNLIANANEENAEHDEIQDNISMQNIEKEDLSFNNIRKQFLLSMSAKHSLEDYETWVFKSIKNVQKCSNIEI